MTITQDIRTRARHRGLTPWQLVQKIGRLERENDSVACQLMALATEIDQLSAARNQLEGQLDAAGIELSGAREDLAAAEQELTQLRAFKANVTAIDAPAGHRDVDADDHPTEPAIDVRPLWAALGHTAVTDPGQTTWGAHNQQQEAAS